jgi:hypothetical protein
MVLVVVTLMEHLEMVDRTLEVMELVVAVVTTVVDLDVLKAPVAEVATQMVML